MRFYEFARSTLKPIKPMNPAQHRVYSMKRNVDQAKDALKREKDAQKRRRDLARIIHQQCREGLAGVV